MTVRHKKETALSALDLHDWVLLTLLVAFGLVLVRLILIYTVATASCAETIAAAGLIEEGLFAGQTVWSLLYWISGLCVLYAVTVIGTDRRESGGMFVFRFVMLVGFLGLTWGLRLMVVEDVLVPDGYIFLDRSQNILKADGQLNEAAYRFDWEQVITGQIVFDHSCAFKRGGRIVTEGYFAQTPRIRYRARDLLFGGKGRLIEGLQESQTYRTLRPEQMEMLAPYISNSVIRFSDVPPDVQMIGDPPGTVQDE